MAKTYPLNIVIGAVDKATAKIRAVQNRISAIAKPLQRVAASVANFSNSIGLTRVGQEAFEVGKTIASLAVAATAGATAVGFLALRSSAAIDSLGELAERLGVGVEQLQAWRYGFKLAGVDAEIFDRAMDDLNTNVGQAALGMGRAAPILKALRINLKDSTGQLKSMEQLLPEIADSLTKFRDPAIRAGIASRLFGAETGRRMAEALKNGSAGLKEMTQAAREAGAVISEDTVRGAAKLNDTLDILKMSIFGVAGNLLGKLYPALTKISESLQAVFVRYQPQIMAWADEFGRNLPGNIDRLVTLFKQLGDAVAPFITAIGWVVDNFGAANTLMTAMAVIIGGKLLIAVAALGFNLAALGVSMTVAFAAPALIVAGILAVIAVGYLLIKHWDKVSDAIGGTIEQIGINFSLLWGRVKTGAMDAVNWISEKFQWLVDHHPLVMAFRGVRSLLGGGGGPAPAGVAGGAPIGDRLMGMATAPVQRVEVGVDFRNMPPGTRANAQATGGIPLELNRGYAMPGVP